MRLPGAGAFLRAVPSLYTYKVSSELYRVQLSQRLFAPIPGLSTPGTKCVCGYAGPALSTGVHFMSQCPSVCLNTTKHNSLVRIIAKMMTDVGWIVRNGESANWVRSRPDLRPFDILYKQDRKQPKWGGIDVGIADPSRVGMLSAGTAVYGAGQAAQRLVERKKSRFHGIIRTYGALKAPADYEPIAFEATGASGLMASKLLTKVYSEAAHKATNVPKGFWSFSAQTFSAHWQQRISFEISKYSAMAILLGVRAIAKADVSSHVEAAAFSAD